MSEIIDSLPIITRNPLYVILIALNMCVILFGGLKMGMAREDSQKFESGKSALVFVFAGMIGNYSIVLIGIGNFGTVLLYFIGGFLGTGGILWLYYWIKTSTSKDGDIKKGLEWLAVIAGFATLLMTLLVISGIMTSVYVTFPGIWGGNITIHDIEIFAYMSIMMLASLTVILVYLPMYFVLTDHPDSSIE